MKTLYESYNELYQQSKLNEKNAISEKSKSIIRKTTETIKNTLDSLSIEQAEILIEEI